MTELEYITLEFHVEIVFIILDLAHKNQVYCTRDVSFLNSFENVLLNEIVLKLVLFLKKKKKIQ